MDGKDRKKSDKIRKIINLLIFIAVLAVFLTAAVKLVRIGWNYYSSDREYRDLQEYVKENTQDGSLETATGDQGDTAAEFSVDFAGLKKENPDCIGWIRFPDQDISYPILQGDDNEYYLKHTFRGEQLTAASIFMDYRNQPDFSDDNTFIYGHNMKNKSMFGKLNNYKEESFYRENPGFYIYTPDSTCYYKIFSCYLAEVEGQADSFDTSFASEQEYAEYQKAVKARSAYDTGVAVDGSQKMVTLMTCNRAGYDYRFLVHAVLTEVLPAE